MQHVSKGARDHEMSNYLENSLQCRWMYNQITPPDSCLELLKLDQICQKWAEQTQSPSVCVRLASLTGNVSYLIKAILLLTRPDPLALLGCEVTSPILTSSRLLLRSPYYKAPSKIEIKIEPSELGTKLEVFKSTLYLEDRDFTVRYVKNEKHGRTLTDPLLTRI